MGAVGVVVGAPVVVVGMVVVASQFSGAAVVAPHLQQAQTPGEKRSSIAWQVLNWDENDRIWVTKGL